MVAGYKDLLPTKAKHDFYPHIIWIAPPLNINFCNNKLRVLFSDALESAVEEYPEMCMLTLRKVWDEDEPAFYRKEQRRFTPEGYHVYWLAVDASIKFWSKALSEILIKKQKKAVYTLKNDNKAPNPPSDLGNKGLKQNNFKTTQAVAWRRSRDTYWKTKAYNPEPHQTKNPSRMLPKPPPVKRI